MDVIPGEDSTAVSSPDSHTDREPDNNNKLQPTQEPSEVGSGKENSGSEASSLRTTPEKKSETSESKEPTSTSEGNGSENEVTGVPAPSPSKTVESEEDPAAVLETIDLVEVKTLTHELLEHERLHSRENIVKELDELSSIVNETTPEKKSETSESKEPTSTSEGNGSENEVTDVPAPSPSKTVESEEDPAAVLETIDLVEVKTLTHELLEHERLHSRENIVKELDELSSIVNEEELSVQMQNLKNKLTSDSIVEHVNGVSDREDKDRVLENGTDHSSGDKITLDDNDVNDSMECDRGVGDGANEQDEVAEADLTTKVIKTDDSIQVEEETEDIVDESKEKSEAIVTRYFGHF
ncbi:uncharacterized protein LOC113467772 [Diaphorina citri]|uniref:Uncharacterized protein LOC113467772 n=1 Tax=Diaphorina citri TaxID=121845 RepID=A0A3Q0IUN0_DIACI|nr:uncharacterized protein LOC113467772 [Diaphorina citri]